MPAQIWRHPGYTPRRGTGLTAYERALARAGLSPVAGIDEAGRGACAGPLVVAAVMLNPARLSGLRDIADSKALTPAAREEAYAEVTRTALAWHRVIIPAADIDASGLHVCNIAGMRRALAGLARTPGYVLTDGFPVRGLGVPALAMWKGDQVAACVAAASIVAKVTRDRIMTQLGEQYPAYGFGQHKGYSTRSHMQALAEHGPCPEHRASFANVMSVTRGLPEPPGGWAEPSGEFGAAELGVEELGVGELGADELGVDELGGDEVGVAGPGVAELPGELRDDGACLGEDEMRRGELTYG